MDIDREETPMLGWLNPDEEVGWVGCSFSRMTTPS